MGKRKRISNAGDAAHQVMSVLNDHTYQTASLIAAQIIVPPDAIYRRALTDPSLRSLDSAKINIVSRIMQRLTKSNRVIRRRGESGLFEYVLPPKKRRGDMMKAVQSAVDSGADPYSVCEKRSTVQHYLWLIKKRRTEQEND